jgi:hypothetical protein
MKQFTDKDGSKVIQFTSPCPYGHADHVIRAEVSVSRDGSGSILVRDTDAAEITLDTHQVQALEEFLEKEMWDR